MKGITGVYNKSNEAGGLVILIPLEEVRKDSKQCLSKSKGIGLRGSWMEYPMLHS